MTKKKLMTALTFVAMWAPFSAIADQATSAPAMSVNAKARPKPVSYTQGEMIREGELPAGYSQTAAYKIEDGYDIYLTADFIYWNLHQDLMRLGTLISTSETGSTAFFDGNSQVVFLNPTYKPGFQLGLGFDLNGMDDWNLYLDYTWYQNQSQKTVEPNSKSRFVVSSILSAIPAGADSAVLSAGGLTANLHYHYNNVNLSLLRPFYFGKKLLANFGFGLRALWVTQTYSEEATDLLWTPSSSSDFSLSGSLTANNHQKSWALGPRFCFGSNWLLSYGFRLMADVAASVLYTRYTSLTADVSGTASLGVDADWTVAPQHHSYNTLRAVTETDLGMGWGMYFGDEDYFHLDITASYEFNIYWNQNMYGLLVNGLGSPGNTYLQGLNVGLRFDF